MSDEELYYKMQFLQNDDENLGCFFKGHCDMEQFKRVAVDFLKTESDWEVQERYREARKGYYKVVPQRNGLIYWFSETAMRGSIPVMEMQYR
jgi:hypothetical protein